MTKLDRNSLTKFPPSVKTLSKFNVSPLSELRALPLPFEHFTIILSRVFKASLSKMLFLDLVISSQMNFSKMLQGMGQREVRGVAEEIVSIIVIW